MVSFVSGGGGGAGLSGSREMAARAALKERGGGVEGDE